MEATTIKGQAWFITTDTDENQKTSLVQEQILILPDGRTCSNQVELISDVFDNLLNGDAGEYQVKTNNKGYFYFTYKMTDTADEQAEVEVNIEAPRPIPGLFEEPYDPTTGKTEWAKFWLTKLKNTQDNLKIMNIQRAEYTLPGSTRMNWQTGETETLEEITVVNNDLGDITNLLNLF